jgi:hypothetical protein
MRKVLWLAAALLPAAYAACGGKVVANGTGDGGGSSTQNGQGGFGAACAVATPVGPLEGCSAVISGDGCSGSCVDGANTVYQVACDGSACRCQYNGFTKCTCALDSGEQACGDTGIRHCCPAPWPDF